MPQTARPGRHPAVADRLPLLPAGPYRLRRFEQADAALVQEAGLDPVIPLVSRVPARPTVEEAAAFVAAQQHRLRDGYGYSFVVADAVTDDGVGSVGLWLRDADQGRASVGYWVVARARRRGAAGQALRAVCRWAFADLGFPRLELYVEPWNLASMRTAERAGFVKEGLLRSWQPTGRSRCDVYLYSLLPGDAEPGASGADGAIPDGAIPAGVPGGGAGGAD